MLPERGNLVMRAKYFILVFVMVTAGVVFSTEPPVPKSFLGISLYPQNTPFAGDTLGWRGVVAVFGLDTGRIATNPRSACPLFARQGYSLLEITDAPAAAIGLLHRRIRGYVALSRWYYLSIPQLPPGVFASLREPDACPAVSPLLWESTESAVIDAPTYMRRDYGIRIAFVNNGSSLYPGLADVHKAFVPMDLESGPAWVDRDHYMKRRVIALYAVVDAGTRDIARTAGILMDSMHLDATYKPPRARPVHCTAEDASRLVRVQAVKGADADSAAPAIQRVDTQISGDGTGVVSVPVDSVAAPASADDRGSTVPADSISADSAVMVEVIGDEADTNQRSAHFDTVADTVSSSIPAPVSDTLKTGRGVVAGSNTADGSIDHEITTVDSSGQSGEDSRTKNANGVFIAIACALINTIPMLIFLMYQSIPNPSR